MKAEEKWALASYIVSCISIATYMGHFWGPVGNILWAISGVCATFCIYSGKIHRQTIAVTDTKGAQLRGLLVAGIVIGCLVLLGLTLSAIFMFHTIGAWA